MNLIELQVILDEICAPHQPIDRWHKRERIFSKVQYENLDDECKCRVATFCIEESCSCIGAMQGNGDAFHFLANVMNEAKEWPEETPVNNRRLEHILYAISHCGACTSSEGALAATYLLTQLEYIFRLLSSHLDPDGNFKSEVEKKAACAATGQPFGQSINRINWTYEIMLLNPTSHAVRCFALLDTILPKRTLPRGFAMNHIGERLAYMRNPAAHGAASDISSEGIFYGLLTAMALVGANVFERKA